MDKSLSGGFCHSLDRPTLALKRGDVSQQRAFEKRSEILDADFSLFDCAGCQGVFNTFQPAVRNGFKTEFCVIGQGQTTNLHLDFFQPSVGQFSAFGFERATKLLSRGEQNRNLLGCTTSL